MQDYDIRNKYYGNPILDNIDPMVWHLKDEFNEMRFDINIALSKTEYKNLCKEAGVPVNKFWTEKNEKKIQIYSKDIRLSRMSNWKFN